MTQIHEHTPHLLGGDPLGRPRPTPADYPGPTSPLTPFFSAIRDSRRSRSLDSPSNDLSVPTSPPAKPLSPKDDHINVRITSPLRQHSGFVRMRHQDVTGRHARSSQVPRRSQLRKREIETIPTKYFDSFGQKPPAIQ
eukprot:2791143-Pyramimonas_sp.AAC.1